MKSQRYILAVLAVVLVGIGLWWFLRPPAPQEKASAATLPAKAVASVSDKVEPPKPLAPPTIAAPALKPAAASVAATSAPDANSDPQADLKTAIPDIVRILRANDLMALVQNYTPPDKLTPRLLQQAQKTADQLQAAQAMAASLPPDIQERINHPFEQMAKGYEVIIGQVPTMNAAGDEATYMVSMPGPPDPNTGDSVSTPVPQTFIKINGKWYMKEDPVD